MRPLGFRLRDREVRRAGLDYAALAYVRVHEDWTACLACLEGRRLFAVTTRGTQRYDLARYRPDDAFVFGPETRGLPANVLESFPPERRLRVPMREGNRSLNLANAVAVVLYEAWRQNDFV